MGYNLDDLIVIGISSQALFDLNFEQEIFKKNGLLSYIDYQLKHENKILNK